ncbi:MAG: peptide ABC transporter substrate-binding protein [Chloroflexia bacterium]|nr:peptide ABC transporter substrate-binding protein [Chloroflexia bacterium]
MNDPFRLSRRHLVSASALNLFGLSLTGAGTRAASIVQDEAERWRIDDGLRLAGSVTGPASLDPALSRDLSTNFLLRQVFRGLMSLDASLEPVLELAESVDIPADGLTYAFAIRESAKFHDGRSVTPADVQVSLSRALDPRTGDGAVEALAGITYLQDIEGAPEQLAGMTDTLAGIAITGDRSLTITLAQRSPTFLMKLASVPASIVDSRQVQAAADWATAPNGSGPFSVAGWEPSESLELRSADTWWRGEPAVPVVRVRLGSSASQPVNLYQAGEIDLVEDVPPELIDLISDPATGVTFGDLVTTELFATSYIAFGNANPPLDDVHVRRALQYVFPADLVATASFNGAVRPASGLLPPGLPGADWPTGLVSGDVGAARRELERSRYGAAVNVPPIAIYAADIAAVEALRDTAEAALGLTIEAIQVGWPDFLAGLSDRRFPAYALYWGADYPDPEALIGMLFGENSADNYTGYVNQELELLLDEARVTVGDERAAVFARANQLLVDDAALLPLYHSLGYTITRPGLAGVDVTPMGILGLESIREG